MSILFAHALVQHMHHSQISSQEDIKEHNSARSIFDHLQITFHTDLGQDHLEDFFSQSFKLELTDFSVGIGNSRIDLLNTLGKDHYSKPCIQQYYPPAVPFNIEYRGPPTA
jgi:hypothetical protein